MAGIRITDFGGLPSLQPATADAGYYPKLYHRIAQKFVCRQVRMAQVGLRLSSLLTR